MISQTLIDECRLSGVLIYMDDGALKLRGAPDAVRAAADRLRPHKVELLRHWQDRTADHAHQLHMDRAGTKPAHEWLAMIRDLNATIGEYCGRFRLDDGSRARILEVRRKQSLFSIEHSLDWFRKELDA